MAERKALLVTTAHGGVFFGYGEMGETIPEEVTIEQARMCISWPEDTHGVLGLAAKGPLKGAKISFSVPTLQVNAVTAIVEVSPEAEQRFAKDVW